MEKGLAIVGFIGSVVSILYTKSQIAKVEAHETYNKNTKTTMLALGALTALAGLLTTYSASRKEKLSIMMAGIAAILSSYVPLIHLFLKNKALWRTHLLQQHPPLQAISAANMGG